jgi:voltage-gated potassium channel
MAARVPLFSTLDAAAVTEVTKLLYTRTFQPGRALVVSAGQPGGAMYLIGGGETTVCVVPRHPIKLHEGDRRRTLSRLCAAQRGASPSQPPWQGSARGE